MKSGAVHTDHPEPSGNGAGFTGCGAHEASVQTVNALLNGASQRDFQSGAVHSVYDRADRVGGPCLYGEVQSGAVHSE
jgi:hypothetical protein